MGDKHFVYKHIREDKNTIFYIGIGKIYNRDNYKTFRLKHYRAYSKQGRNPIWKNIVNKTNYSVEIIADNLSFNKAKTLEIKLIAKYGKIKNKGLLSNISDGGETVLPELLTVLNDPKCSQLVYQYDLKGKFIKEWLSSNQIKRELGFDNSVIRKALNGKTKSPNISYNFQWFLEYKGDIINSSDSGKTTLHKPVKAIRNKEVLLFNSRKDCSEYFNVDCGQVTNAINKNWKLKKYKIENYEKK